MTHRIIDDDIRLQPWVPLLKGPCFKLLFWRRSHAINHIKEFPHISCLSKSDSNTMICYQVRIWGKVFLKGNRYGTTRVSKNSVNFSIHLHKRAQTKTANPNEGSWLTAYLHCMEHIECLHRSPRFSKYIKGSGVYKSG